jgi:hypothetical protein
MGLDVERATNLGRATVDPSGPAVVGSYGTFRVVYRPGPEGLAPGGAFGVAWIWPSDWGEPQFADPAGADYATAQASSGSPVQLTYSREGYLDPYQKLLLARVRDGLRPGEELVITFGDQNEGGPGSRVQTFRETRHHFLPVVDADGSGNLVALAEWPSLPVVGGPAVKLAVLRPGKPRAEVLCFGDRYLDSMIDARRDLRMTLFAAPRKPSIELCAGPNGRIGYRAWSSEALIGSGELELNKPVPSWFIPRQNASILLTAKDFVANGRPDVKLIPRPLEPRENGERGAVVELRTPDGKATVNLYRNPEAFEDRRAAITLRIKDRLVRLRLTSEELQLPFAIRLDDEEHSSSVLLPG